MFDFGTIQGLLAMEDDEEDEFLFVRMAFEQNRKRRHWKWKHTRIDWVDHLAKEHHTGNFNSRYHMDVGKFNILVSRLRPWITVDFRKSMNSTSGNIPIYPELVVATGLRYLGGELWKSLEDMIGMSYSSVKRVVDMFFDAVDVHESFDIRLPALDDPEDLELRRVASGFKDKSSSEGLFDGVVGAIDGWLCCTNSPIDRDITNKRSYFSGHYKRFGLNVQAMCDSELRFTYFAVCAPGGTNDARAVRRCTTLQKWLQDLQGSGFFIVGDNAYVLSNELLIPFSGTMNETQRTYNFFLSQLRIRIELAFGRLVTKWRIFHRDLEFGMERNSKICLIAAKLHNFVINETLQEEGLREESVTPHPHAVRVGRDDLGFPAHNPTRIDSLLVLDPENEDDELPEPGHSTRRENFLYFIQANGLVRPHYNVERNG